MSALGGLPEEPSPNPLPQDYRGSAGTSPSHRIALPRVLGEGVFAGVFRAFRVDSVCLVVACLEKGKGEAHCI